MKLKHLKTINELYSDTYLSARDKTLDTEKKKAFNQAYVNKFLEEGGDINDVIDDIIEYDTDINIDLSSDEYIFKDINGSNRKLIEKCLRKGSKHLIPLTKNKSIVETVIDLFCYDMNLTDLKGIENLTNLENLHCYNNLLTDLKGIENLTDLRCLSCYNNLLTDLKGIENLTRLESLYCGFNKLSNLRGIENLNHLQTLYCHNNPLDPPYTGSIKKEQERLKNM